MARVYWSNSKFEEDRLVHVNQFKSRPSFSWKKIKLLMAFALAAELTFTDENVAFVRFALLFKRWPVSEVSLGKNNGNDG